jgi:hypothetical protein
MRVVGSPEPTTIYYVKQSGEGRLCQKIISLPDYYHGDIYDMKGESYYYDIKT